MTESGAAALVDAAEELFAVEGIEGASLRGVMRRAGTDPGSVHYHFGGREALAAAVLDRILVPLNDRRLVLLAEREVAGELAAVDLVDALIRPDIEVAAELENRGRGRSRLIGNIYLHPAAFVEQLVEQRFAPVAVRFMPRFAAVLPEVDGELIGWRIRWCVFATTGALLASRQPAFDTHSVDELLDRLVPTLTSAVAAPTKEIPR